ncbi:MAG: hypothetical protein H6710_16300 [Myxococcales bacterium]|nr:hypothetical protein [Myxococcales bacterium]MCB9706601.1 hypothetical protein [Myxococcales bacterium]
MRRRPPHAGAGVLGLALALALALLPGGASATSCEELGSGYYDSPFDNPSIEVPIDAHPWFHDSCGSVYEGGCTLVLDAPTQLSIAGSVDLGDCEGDEATIARVIPAEPLLPGVGYDVTCGEYTIGYLRVRADAEPSQPPLHLGDVTLRREIEDGCCYDRSVTIRADLGGPEELFFGEGGIIEIRYADGRLFVEDDAPGEYGWSLPDTEDDVTFTAVNAAGARAEPIVLRHQDFEEDLVYIPCAVAVGGRGALGLWLVLPIAWLRRRRAGR